MKAQNIAIFSCIKINTDILCLSKLQEEAINQEYFIISYIQFNKVLLMKMPCSTATPPMANNM